MTLRRIVLRDFVIVGELELDLSSGFTVLTGETGAGKSILIDALQLVTGARADAGTVREGASRTDVSAEFDAPAGLQSRLEAGGFDTTDTLLMRRTVDLQGKSRGWINGSPATATQMREIGEQLIDIHGQHAWQSLTRPEAVRNLLDAYARVDTTVLTKIWNDWRAKGKALSDAQAIQADLQREHERISWQIGELDKLAPGPDEWDLLSTEHNRLSNAQALLEAAQVAVDALQDGQANAAGAVQTALNQLQQQSTHEPAFAALANELSSSLAQLEDVAHSLRTYLRKTEPNPQRLAELDARLASWISLSRRYKRPASELPRLLADWRTDLARLDAATDLAGLQAAEQAAQAAYMREARSLSRARAKAAPLLAKAITQAMQGLGMTGGSFDVRLGEVAQPMQTGLDESRLALAIAVTTSRLGTAQTLIFDEVDAGVGGAVAETVGKLMRQLGVDRQVLAVTHLPQVAVSADQHLVVSKQLRGASTLSAVEQVQGESRVAEIARMLGGERLLETTVAHAKEMLQSSA